MTEPFVLYDKGLSFNVSVVQALRLPFYESATPATSGPERGGAGLQRPVAGFRSVASPHKKRPQPSPRNLTLNLLQSGTL